MVSGILLVLASLPIGQQPLLDPNRSIDGLALMSTDNGLMRKLFETVSFPAPIPTLRQALPSNRFEFRDWGKKYLIVLDREHPMIKAELDEVALIDVFGRNVHPQGYLEMPSLKNEDQKRVVDYLTSFGYAYDTETLKKATIAVASGATYTVEGRGGSLKGASAGGRISPDNLKRISGTPVTNITDPGELSRRREASLRAMEAKSSVNLRYFGNAIFFPGGAMETAGKELDKLIAFIEVDQQVAARRLATRLGLPTDGMTEPIPIGRLSPEDRTQLQENFVGMWKVNGFASPDEARNFLDAAGNVRRFTSLSMRISAGDKTGHGYPLGRFKGG